MRKKAQLPGGVVGGIVGLVIAIVIGIVALQVVDNEVSKTIEPQTTINEAITTSNATAVSLENDNLVSNASCTLTPFICDTTAGTILHSDTHPSNSTTCNYTYYDNAYSTRATARTVLGLTPTVWAIVLLSIVAMFAIVGKIM